VHVAASPTLLEVGAGQSATFHVAVTNTSPAIDAYHLQVFGVDPTWVVAEPSRLSLFPGDVEHVAVTVTLPVDYPSSERTLAINVVAESDPTEFALDQVQLAVQPSTKPVVTLDPVVITGGAQAVFGLVVANAGNAPMRARAVATDPEDLAEFVFEPPEVLVPPGRTQVVRTTVTGGRAWFGQPRARTFEIGVEADERVHAVGTFIQKPRISRWLLSLLGLLLAAAVFALVLSRTFNQVVEEASVDDRLIEQALTRDSPGGVLVPVNPAGISGSVVSASTGTGVSGVQAELFLADDTNVPIATAATDSDGSFTFARLGAGGFKLRFSGAGFDSIWFGASSTPADATEIETDLGEVTELDEFALGARPGSVSGAVLGQDPVGAVVTLTVPGQLDPDSPAQVAQVEASADGSFVFDEVPSPAVYRLQVVKPGFATETRDVVLRPAQALEGIEVLLRAGDGAISGSVNADGGPLGGVTVEATDGAITISTVTLTEGDVGSFSLRNLPTPGRYTVTFSRDGFTSESRSVSLGTAETIGGFSSNLTRAVGSIRGTVSVDGEGPTGGITVTVTGGDEERVTTSVSQGVVGAYQFSELPIPGTYTITFTRDGLVSQVRLVDLDAGAGRPDAEGIDATLVRDRAVVRGTVRGPDGVLLPRASVVLSDGTTDATFLTADDPVGEFEFAGVVPGAYTLTASRPGTTPVVVLVNVLASQVESVDLTLGAQASLSGQVRRFDDETETFQPFAGATVRLFSPDAFPGTPQSASFTTETAADGSYSFTGLDAPGDWVVAVYLNAGTADPLDSTTVATEPGQNVSVATIDVAAT
jgi:hypothetical protein